MQYMVINGEMVAENAARISPADRGFRYGDGVFDTIAVHEGVPYGFEWHMKRLEAGLGAVRIDFDVASLEKQCRALLGKNKMTDGLIRIQVTRGVGGRGYLPGNNAPTCVIETMMPAAAPKNTQLWLSTIRKISPDALPVQYKLCQGLGSTLARIEADEQDCFEALMLNSAGHVCETSAANIFWVRNNIVYTPALSCGVLEGSVRARLTGLCEVREACEPVEILAHAEAVFITNAALGIVSVSGLKPLGYAWEAHALVVELGELLARDVAQYTIQNKTRWELAE